MNPTEHSDDNTDSARQARQWLSAAADGDAAAIEQASQLWRVSPDARATWHRYHLIGDVMRSGELARGASHDAAFLAALRSRMATEPVLLAPTPTSAPPAAAPRLAPRLVPRWWAPTAAAAGLAVVAGVLVVSRLSGPLAPTADRTAAAQPAEGVQRVANGPVSSTQSAAPGHLIRDPRLDEFLRAHQSARGGFAAAVPGGALRRVDAELREGARQ